MSRRWPLNAKLQAKQNWINTLLLSGASDGRIVEQVYLAALSRLPTKVEKSKYLAIFAEAKDDKRLLVEDFMWSILSSSEFLFNH